MIKYTLKDREMLDNLTDLKISQDILKYNKWKLKKSKMLERMWTAEEINFIKDNWGILSKQEIADKLNKTLHQITNKANRLGFKDYFLYSDKITVNNLYQCLQKRNAGGYDFYILERNNFPIEMVTTNKELAYKCVSLDKFYAWYKKHIDAINLCMSEDDALPNEPEWFKEKRKADKLAKPFIRQRNWTVEEDNKLREMVESQKYSYREISIELKRTGGAITRRMEDLNLPKRPLKADKHNYWSDKDIETVKDLWLKGYKSSAMMYFINRSDKAIQGLIERHNYFDRPPLKFKGVKR